MKKNTGDFFLSYLGSWQNSSHPWRTPISMFVFSDFFKITGSCNKVEINCCQVQTAVQNCFLFAEQCRNRIWHSCLASLCSKNHPQNCSTGNSWAFGILPPPAEHLCAQRCGLILWSRCIIALQIHLESPKNIHLSSRRWYWNISCKHWKGWKWHLHPSNLSKI